MSNESQQQKKREYSKPKLHTYGDIGSMTQGSMSVDMRDNISLTQPRTT